MLHSLETKQLKAQLKEYNKRLEDTPMPKWACMYMDKVETLLQFIRATRCSLWHLHLVSLEKLCHFFFIQNPLKYVQYIAKMLNMKKTDPEVWQFFCKGNVSVKKSGQEFCNIGVDTLWSKLIELWKWWVV